MTNPFDDPDGNVTVLVNSAHQHSLWPASIPVPEGWTTAFGPGGRGACLDYVNSAWRDPRLAPVPSSQAGEPKQ